MTEVFSIRRDGVELRVDAENGYPLMEALRDSNCGVDGTCGGAMSCGSCHVYVDSVLIARLPAKSEDEQAMLDAIGELVELRPGSRLSCQIQMSQSLAGLKVTVAPEF